MLLLFLGPPEEGRFLENGLTMPCLDVRSFFLYQDLELNDINIQQQAGPGVYPGRTHYNCPAPGERRRSLYMRPGHLAKSLPGRRACLAPALSRDDVVPSQEGLSFASQSPNCSLPPPSRPFGSSSQWLGSASRGFGRGQIRSALPALLMDDYKIPDNAETGMTSPGVTVTRCTRQPRDWAQASFLASSSMVRE